MIGTLPENDVVFYNFSPGIPWRVKNGEIEPVINRIVWDKLVNKNEVFILCPGYFIEVLLIPLFYKILKKNKINNINIIVPSYYNDFLDIFGLSNDTEDESDSIFKEHYRLMEAVESYPVPIFLDREGNAYFNILYNYGEKKQPRGEFIDRKYEPFWKQILNNSCCYPYDSAYPYFDKDLLKPRLEKLFKRYGININKPYVIVDNSSFSYKTSDNRAVVPRTLLLHHIQTIASTLLYKKHQVIVMNSKPSYYGVGNIYKVPAWYDLNSADLFVLLANSSGVYSSDPNVYLSAALIGCPKIFNGGNFDDGFCLKDVANISVFKGRKIWEDSDDIDLTNIIRTLL